MVCCMSRINYLVLLISQKDYEVIRFFSLFLVDIFLVVYCLGWIWPVKCFERFASRGVILGNGVMAEKLPVIIDNLIFEVSLK